MTRSADTPSRRAARGPAARASTCASVSSRLGFLHKAKQVKEYDHWRYIEMARGPEGRPALQREPPYCFRLAVPALVPGPDAPRALRERRRSSWSRTRSSSASCSLLWLHLRDLGFALPLRVDRPPRRRLHPGRRALVRVPVLDDRPRGALPGDAGLLPDRAREGGRRSSARASSPPSCARPTSSSTPTSSCASCATGRPLLGGRRAHRGARRPAVRDPGRHPPPRHAEPARRLRLRHRRQHDASASTTCSTTSPTW